MKASETRALARQNLAGKWGNAVLAALLFVLIFYAIAFALIFIPVLGPILFVIISVPLNFGFLVTLFKLNDGTEISYVGFLNDGFTNFGKVWRVALHMFLKLIVPIILVVITAIMMGTTTVASHMSLNTTSSIFSILRNLSTVLYILALIYMTYKSLLYNFSLHILADNPGITGKEAVEKSAELMKGNVWKYICLHLSFIGWIFLLYFINYFLLYFISTSFIALLPILVGILFLIPYMRIAEINFYRNLDGQI